MSSGDALRAAGVNLMSGGIAVPSDVLRPELLQWRAYAVGDSRGMVKLDAMENPYALPEGLRAPLRAALAEAALNRYPDPAATELAAALRRTLGVPADAGMMLGNGSDELIQILCQAVARPGAVVMGLEPSFVLYRSAAEAAGCRFVGVPLTASFQIDLPALARAVETHRPALLFLAYPNNPTGNLFPREAVESVLALAPGLVVVDEAYHAFARQTYLGELSSRPHLLVMRTLSKLGLAGLRLGLLTGGEGWIHELDKLRLPYNINVLTQHAARFALDHLDVLLAQAQQILEDRTALLARLRSLPGIEVFPTDANFVLFRVSQAPRVFEGLLRRRVLIRNLSAAHPLLHDCLRVTVGTPVENRQFQEALAATLAELGSVAAGTTEG